MIGNKIQETIHSLSLVQNAVSSMHTELEAGKTHTFYQLAERIDVILQYLSKEGVLQHNDHKGLRLEKAAICCRYSLSRIVRLSCYNQSKALHKIEFELIPFVNDMYSEYYFWTCIFPYKEKWEEYYNNEMPLLQRNPYIEESRKTGRYKYDLSIFVFAYNKLELTKMCIECLIDNIPKNITCELILVDNGSTEDIKGYFESVMPTKQFDIQENRAIHRPVERVLEGEYYLMVSNDVLVTPHAIENMMRILKEDPETALVVPTTPNVSNYQSIPSEFDGIEEMIKWAEKNNVYDPFRHEQRTRLVNPAEMGRTEYILDNIPTGYHLSEASLSYSFPDDTMALNYRRKGFRLILAKDAYCYHFGSVTIKDETGKHTEDQKESYRLYTENRKKFEEYFGIDPWGTGFCYDPIFSDFDCKFEGHIEILGINSGIGANPLKLRELYKEKRHNIDVTLTFVDQDEKYFDEVKAFSDHTARVASIDEVINFAGNTKYHYIVVEEPFRKNGISLTDLDRLADIMVPDGEVFITTDKEIKSKRFKCNVFPKESKSVFVNLVKL